MRTQLFWIVQDKRFPVRTIECAKDGSIQNVQIEQSGVLTTCEVVDLKATGFLEVRNPDTTAEEDCEISLMEKDLFAAGWILVFPGVWQDPTCVHTRYITKAAYAILQERRKRKEDEDARYRNKPSPGDVLHRVD